MRGCDRGILMRRLLRRTAPFLFRSRGGACAGGVDGSDRGVVLRRGEDGASFLLASSLARRGERALPTTSVIVPATEPATVIARPERLVFRDGGTMKSFFVGGGRSKHGSSLHRFERQVRREPRCRSSIASMLLPAALRLRTSSAELPTKNCAVIVS